MKGKDEIELSAEGEARQRLLDDLKQDGLRRPERKPKEPKVPMPVRVKRLEELVERMAHAQNAMVKRLCEMQQKLVAAGAFDKVEQKSTLVAPTPEELRKLNS